MLGPMITATPDTSLSQPDDLVALLGRLTAAELRERIAQLEAEQRALRALLRSVSARERALARRREGPHAS
jgi:hypothetical protein